MRRKFFIDAVILAATVFSIAPPSHAVDGNPFSGNRSGNSLQSPPTTPVTPGLDHGSLPVINTGPLPVEPARPVAPRPSVSRPQPVPQPYRNNANRN